MNERDAMNPDTRTVPSAASLALDRIAMRLDGFAAFQTRPGACAELEQLASEIRTVATALLGHHDRQLNMADLAVDQVERVVQVLELLRLDTPDDQRRHDDLMQLTRGTVDSYRRARRTNLSATADAPPS
jgi:hypothetical protein